MSDVDEKLSLEDLTQDGSFVQPVKGYEAWKAAKVQVGLEQAKNRACMIPLDDVWKRFGFER